MSDLARSVDFYERVLGLPADRARDEERACSAPTRRRPPLVLAELRGAERRHRRTSTGLYPRRLAAPLARGARRHRAPRRSKRGWRFEGASDHGVSEALYLSDPDGLGDRALRRPPREQWARPPDGRGVDMCTLPLDVEDLLAQAPSRRPRRDRPGHVRRPRAPEGRRRAAGGRLLRRRARLRGAGAAPVGGVPLRRRLPPPPRAELLAERGRGARARAALPACGCVEFELPAASDALERASRDARPSDPAASSGEPAGEPLTVRDPDGADARLRSGAERPRAASSRCDARLGARAPASSTRSSSRELLGGGRARDRRQRPSAGRAATPARRRRRCGACAAATSSSTSSTAKPRSLR